MGDTYGFPKELCCQFQLITGKRFETYLNGFGKTRLRQIKYKYFSDKALQLWDLCYAFFDEARQVYINTEQREYLLVKSFHIVFEAIIDELVGDNPLLWDLCYAFFDEARQVYINTEQREYLLVKSFHIVFEAIIDELVGDNPLPDGMEKKQEDGKIVDHLFTAQSLIDSEAKQTYYIGDSKYYRQPAAGRHGKEAGGRQNCGPPVYGAKPD